MIKQEVKSRKKRSDRMHVIYVITNTMTLEQYVGLTVTSGLSMKEALAARWSRHVGRAYNQAKDWSLCKSIRKYGSESFVIEPILKIRGKASAHIAERAITKEIGATLNTA